jgi:hypothetical protein
LLRRCSPPCSITSCCWTSAASNRVHLGTVMYELHTNEFQNHVSIHSSLVCRAKASVGDTGAAANRPDDVARLTERGAARQAEGKRRVYDRYCPSARALDNTPPSQHALCLPCPPTHASFQEAAAAACTHCSTCLLSSPHPPQQITLQLAISAADLLLAHPCVECYPATWLPATHKPNAGCVHAATSLAARPTCSSP